MFRNHNQINFGCNVPDNYKNLFIIAEESCLKVSPDGSLGVSGAGLVFSKVYSLKRLSPQYCPELISDINTWLMASHKSGAMRETANHIRRHLLHEFVFFLFKYLFAEFYKELEKLGVIHLIQTRMDDTLIAAALAPILSNDSIRIHAGKNTDLVTAIATAMALQIPLEKLISKKTPREETATMICALFAKIITQKQSDFSTAFCSQIKLLLANIFNEQTAIYLVNALLQDKDKNDGINFIAAIIKNNKASKRHFSAVIYKHINESLALNKHKSKAAIETLQGCVNLESQSSAVEELIIGQLQTHLTADEMALLAARKVSLVATSQAISDHHECRGIFNPAKNTILVKTNKIASSLIHEVQHSFGFDIRPERPLQFFKFYRQCTRTQFFTDKGLVNTLSDTRNLQTYKHSQAGMAIENVSMVKRAEYILRLDNYSSHDRSLEILAHLRQFIADFGQENTARILPKLFRYWRTEILDDSVHHEALDITRQAGPRLRF